MKMDRIMRWTLSRIEEDAAGGTFIRATGKYKRSIVEREGCG